MKKLATTDFKRDTQFNSESHSLRLSVSYHMVKKKTRVFSAFLENLKKTFPFVNFSM